mmetsp:Transcript_21972/g.45379  ORF Transcript_21972/g.45379 Transcript_21972/m.45379 type:complete len:422 (+) Transcript_21972:2610-3875(+)
MDLSNFGVQYMVPELSLSAAAAEQVYPVTGWVGGTDPASQVLVTTSNEKVERPIPEFLFHLTRMLSDPFNRHLIEWDNGRIVVHDPVRLEAEVLGNYYRHSKYLSFQRQLNYFGFRKHSGKGRMSPCHYTNDKATFHLSSLVHLKRKPVKKPRRRRDSIGSTTTATTNTSSTATPEASDCESLSQQQLSLNNNGNHGNTSWLTSVSNRSAGVPPGPTSSIEQTNPASIGLTTIKEHQEVASYRSHPFLVKAEEYKAPGICNALQTAFPVNPNPVSLHSGNSNHSPAFVTPHPSSLNSLSSSSEHSTTSSELLDQQHQQLYKQIVSMPVPDLFSVEQIQQQAGPRQPQGSQNNNFSNMNNNTHVQEQPPQPQPQQKEDHHDSKHDDIATFLALECAFGAGYDSDNYQSEGSTSSYSWLPDPL